MLTASLDETTATRNTSAPSGAQSATNGHNPADLNGTTPQYSIARFNRATDRQPRPEVLPWRDLARLLTTHEKRAAKDGPLFSPTIYRDGATRGKANVEYVTCLVLDFDSGIAPGPLRARWDADGLAYALHSTHSHRHDFPKWRAIFPLARPVAGNDWPGVWRKLAATIGAGHVDVSAKDASRIYYLPACPPEYSACAFAGIHDGAPLDPASIPDLPDETPQRPPIERPVTLNGIDGDPYRERAITDELAALCGAGEGTRNATLNKVAFRVGQFVGAGRYSRSDAEYELQHAALSIGLPSGEAQRTIQSGLDAGEHEPEYSGMEKGKSATFHRAAYAYNHEPAIAAPRNGQVLPIRPDAAPQAEQQKPTFELFNFKDLAKMPRPQWLIRGVLVESVASVLSADSGSYKSFVALDMALSIATGRNWQGREVKQGGAIYVAAEGFYTMFDRATAWAQFHGCELPENFHIVKVPVNLADAGVVALFQQSIEELKPAIVVLDTLSQCAIGANENDNSQMADFVRGMMKLGSEIGAHVQVLHHNAKASGAFRGAGAIKANADAHITLDRPEDDESNTVFVRCEKQRGKPFEAFALRGQEVELPYADEYGDPITTLVFEECGEEVTERKEKHASTQRSNKTRAALLEVFDKVAIEAEQYGGGVKVGFWKEAVEAITPAICSERTFWQYRKALEKDGTIKKCGTHNGSELYRRATPENAGTASTAIAVPQARPAAATASTQNEPKTPDSRSNNGATASTASTAKCSTCSQPNAQGAEYCKYCNNPLGVAVLAVAPHGRKIQLPGMPTITTGAATSEPYTAPADDDEELTI